MQIFGFIALLVLLTSAAELRTYEDLTFKLLDLANEIRAEPQNFADTLAGEPSNFVGIYHSPRGELKWSKGLANSCRDLVKEAGPLGNLHYQGKGPYSRSKVYMNSAAGLAESVVYTNYGNVLNPERDGSEVFIQLMHDKIERDALFNSDFTHVGISCGCHSILIEMCCFQFAINPLDKASVKAMDMAMVDPAVCPTSSRLSVGLLGTKEKERYYN